MRSPTVWLLYVMIWFHPCKIWLSLWFTSFISQVASDDCLLPCVEQTPCMSGYKNVVNESHSCLLMLLFTELLDCWKSPHSELNRNICERCQILNKSTSQWWTATPVYQFEFIMQCGEPCQKNNSLDNKGFYMHSNCLYLKTLQQVLKTKVFCHIDINYGTCGRDFQACFNVINHTKLCKLGSISLLM